MGDGDKTLLQNVYKFVPDNVASDQKARNVYANHNENFISQSIEVT
jgi:hypothetical protein